MRAGRRPPRGRAPLVRTGATGRSGPASPGEAPVPTGGPPVEDGTAVRHVPGAATDRTGASRLRAHLASAGRALGARAVTLPVTALAGLLSTRAVVAELGVAGYALFALAVTLPALVPLGDLGVGAALVDAAARDRSGGGGRELRAALTSGARTLGGAGLVLTCVGVVPAAAGWWGPLLGAGGGGAPGADAVVAVTFSLFGASVFLGLGRSLLIVADRTHLAVLLQGAGSLAALGGLLAAVAVDAPAAVLVAPGFLGQCLAGLVALAWAGGLLRLPVWSLVLGCPRPGVPRARIRHLAGPMAVVQLGSTLAFATDRLVLSHTTRPEAVAAYSAGAQLYVPLVGLVSTAGLPLWVRFAHQRQTSRPGADPLSKALPGTPRTARGDGRRDLAVLTAAFGTAGLAAGAGLVVLGPALSGWMTHGQATAGTGLMAAFALLLVVQAAGAPVGMWLTDAAGLRFQAPRVVAMAAVNLALSVPLALWLGPSGPVLASAAALTALVLVPGMRRAARSE